MAYLKELRKSSCEVRGCIKQAVVEVYDSRNFSRGVYCRKHGNAQVKMIEKEENKYESKDT